MEIGNLVKIRSLDQDYDALFAIIVAERTFFHKGHYTVYDVLVQNEIILVPEWEVEMLNENR